MSVTKDALVSEFKPTTDFEKDIETVLIESGMDEKQLKQTDELPYNNVTEEDLLAQRAHLQKMRSIMFYQVCNQWHSTFIMFSWIFFEVITVWHSEWF